MSATAFRWCLGFMFCGWTAAAAWADESLAMRLPPGAFASAEVVQAAALITRVEESAFVKAVANSDGYKAWADSRDGKKFRGGRAVLEGQLGMNAWEAGRRLIGDRVIAALYPPGEGSVKPRGILLVHFADAEIGPHLRQQFEPWTELAGDELTAEAREDGWYLTAKDGTSACLRGQWFAAASSADLLKEVTSRLSNPSDTSLATSRVFQRAQDTLPSDHTRVDVRVDLDRMRQVAHKDRLLPDKLDNPLGSLLLGAMIEAVAIGQSVQSAVTITPDGFDLAVRTVSPTERLGTGQQALLAARPATNLTPHVPRQLAAITLVRDWMPWYQSREELLIDRVLPEFDKFETGLSTFLPGKDFAQDVLGLLHAPISLVFAGQTYSHLESKPGLQLPAFAVVLELRNPEQGADVFRLFFQTLATIVNIEAGKQGRQPWVMDSENHHGVQVSFAKYLESPKAGELPMVFNFQPAAALVDRRFVAASSLELCRDLVDALQPGMRAEAAAASPARNAELSFDPAVAADLLQANRAVVTAKSVQSGKTIQRADAELDLLLSSLRQWSPIRLTTDVHSDGLELHLSGAWK